MMYLALYSPTAPLQHRCSSRALGAQRIALFSSCTPFVQCVIESQIPLVQGGTTFLAISNAGLHSKPPTADHCAIDGSKAGRVAYHCQRQGTMQRGLQMAPGALGLGRAARLETGLLVERFQALQGSSTGLLGLQCQQALTAFTIMIGMWCLFFLLLWLSLMFIMVSKSTESGRSLTWDVRPQSLALQR